MTKCTWTFSILCEAEERRRTTCFNLSLFSVSLVSLLSISLVSWRLQVFVTSASSPDSTGVPAHWRVFTTTDSKKVKESRILKWPLWSKFVVYYSALHMIEMHQLWVGTPFRSSFHLLLVGSLVFLGREIFCWYLVLWSLFYSIKSVFYTLFQSASYVGHIDSIAMHIFKCHTDSFIIGHRSSHIPTVDCRSS